MVLPYKPGLAGSLVKLLLPGLCFTLDVSGWRQEAVEAAGAWLPRSGAIGVVQQSRRAGFVYSETLIVVY